MGRDLKKKLLTLFVEFAKELVDLLEPEIEEDKTEDVETFESSPVSEDSTRRNPNYRIIKDLEKWLWENASVRDINEVWEDIENSFRESETKGIKSIFRAFKGRYPKKQGTLDMKRGIIVRICLYSKHMLELKNMCSSVDNVDEVCSRLKEGFDERGIRSIFESIAYAGKYEEIYAEKTIARIIECTQFMNDMCQKIKGRFGDAFSSYLL